MTSRVSWSARAQATDTLLEGLNVRSKPPTAFALGARPSTSPVIGSAQSWSIRWRFSARDGLADGNATTVVETDESGAEKDSRGSAGLAVVANQVRLVGAFGTVADGDGFEQVLVARSDAETSNRHHGVDASFFRYGPL